MRKHFNNMGKVKIYGTIGPACRDEDTLRHMFEEGMDGVRLNLSHTLLEETAEMIGNCRRAARACGKTPELLIDMQGPELRIGRLGAPVRLDENDLTDVCSIKLTEAADSCGNIGDSESVVNAHGIIPFPDVVLNALRESCDGQEVLLDDGKILVIETEKGDQTAVEQRRGGKNKIGEPQRLRAHFRRCSDQLRQKQEQRGAGKDRTDAGEDFLHENNLLLRFCPYRRKIFGFVPKYMVFFYQTL